ncbi:MAG: hypothetical protein R6T78_05325 [Dehalococcoidales bacterium]
MAVPLSGCGMINSLISPSALNSQQAIAIIQVAGLPYIDDYYQEASTDGDSQSTVEIDGVTPVGEWTATYDGEGIWQVQGMVATTSWGNCLTTWILDEEDDSKIRLIGFNCG